MTRLLVVLAMFAVLAVQGCAPTGRPVSGDAVPGRVEGFLTATVEVRPYSADEMAIPTIREAVRNCERSRRSGCRERRGPGERRTTFTRGADRHAVAVFRNSGLTPGAAFDRTCRLAGPDGAVAEELRFSETVPLSATRHATNTTTCGFELKPGMPAGRWTVAYAVNGATASTLGFDLVSPGGG